ncbi:NADPH-dependent FMN reductase [Streptomyces griseofuscus]|uniref:NADPH-dependent FMN reductase n=1 Tax=Streptomyces griseofuscus TaxID=146922 RepID=UPI00118BAC20|nr:NADPH-dependent oxidoreductase [Streptomyces rochei]
MTMIGIILGSTRPGRKGEQVAHWVHERATRRRDAEFEVIDLLEHPLPHLDEPVPALVSAGRYRHEHTRAWSDVIAAYDGYVFVTPEYNHAVPGVLKNAIDHLYPEWNNKAVGFVSYGGTGGTHAVEQLRLICGVLQMADVAPQVALSLHTDFRDHTVLQPSDHHAAVLDMMLTQVITWTTTLAPLRTASPVTAA